ncbi:MAG: alpha/beta hydrolase [Ruminococcus sp.]|nr:alpha/beta hydrolase [Ruminococcus sp.]MCM1381128.1 alpha/beta hydrolase [Muribaculaceae bacterium]MCM1478091.1 alpha/beta hydrolase [Muribaculaceae bacterium]
MIYYEKYGDSSSPVIIMLHGTNFVHCFSKQCDKLSKDYRIIVPHIPGFGRNADVTFSVRLAVEQVAELAASFGKKVTLIGFSLGAQLCLPLICRHEELFNGAMFISPWLIKDTAEIEKMMKQWSDNEKSMRNGHIAGLNSLTAGLDKTERQEHNEFCKTVTMKSILASIDNGILLADYPQYAEVKIPIMSICGIKEPTDTRKSVRALAQQNQRCTYDMWDGAGHNIPVKFAARLNKTVAEFEEKILNG